MEDLRRLQLDMHPGEEVWMTQVGHLKDWCPHLNHITLTVGEKVNPATAADHLRMLFLFPELKSLTLRFDELDFDIDQGIVSAVAELLHLTSLEFLSGSLYEEVDLEALTSLSHLQHLALLPDESSGVGDDHLAGVGTLTGLVSLNLTGNRALTELGLVELTNLRALTSLTICPLGPRVLAPGGQAILKLAYLRRLKVGLLDARQMLSLRCLEHIPELDLILLDPHHHSADVLSVCNWCLSHNLVGLKLSNLKVEGGEVLLSLATLTGLTSLKLQVEGTAAQGPRLRTSPRSSVLDLAHLTSLSRLQSFEFICDVNTPALWTPKTAALLAIHWQELTSLSLSLTGTPGLVEGALALLDNFSSLRHLSLFGPLDGAPYESPEGSLVEIHGHNKSATDKVLHASASSPQLVEHGSSPARGLASSSSASLLYACLPTMGSLQTLSSSLSVGTREEEDVAGSVGKDHRHLHSWPPSEDNFRMTRDAGGPAGGPAGPPSLQSKGNDIVAEVNLHYLPCTLVSLMLEFGEVTLGHEGAGNPLDVQPHLYHSASPCQLPALKRLQLQSCVVENDVFSWISCHAPSLISLQLTDVLGLTDLGLKHLSRLTNLIKLVIEDTGLPGQEVAAESTRGGQTGYNNPEASRTRAPGPRISYLGDVPYIAPSTIGSSTAITTASLGAACSLLRLRYLYFATRDMTDRFDATEWVARLGGLWGLRYLGLITNDPSALAPDGWMDELQKQLPMCRISVRHDIDLTSPWENMPMEEEEELGNFLMPWRLFDVNGA